MPRANPLMRLAAEIIERRIIIVRGQRVMLDSQLAELYQIPTRVLNQAVRRNRKRFPLDFAFPLTLQEVTDLKSQFVTSSLTHGGRRKLPMAFTEHGVAMLSSIVRSPIAVRVNIEIMRAFIRLRRLLATPGELVAQLNKLAETVELHDDQIKVISDVLRKMIEPPPAPAKPKGRFGFHMPDGAAK